MTTPPPSAANFYERLGGHAALRAIINDFIDRVTSDVMIGFFFRQIDHARLKELEFQFASSHLGGPDSYRGRPLSKAHGPHPIMGGQFNRRLQILSNTLEDHDLPEDVRRGWLEHNEKLRGLITRDTKDECNDPRAAENLSSAPPQAMED